MTKQIRKRVHFRRGLSHFEMMIVASVIIIMVTILIPVLRRAKKHGEQTHCLGNERQLMTAWYNYTIDHDDRLCDSDYFIESLRPYTKSDDVFYCVSVKRPWEITSYVTATSEPNDQEQGLQDSRIREGNVASRTVSVYGDYGLEYLSCYAVSNTMGGEYRDGVRPYHKYQKITELSRRLVFIDIEPPSGPTFWPIVQSSESSWAWRPRTWPPSLQGLTARHNGGVSAVFADGHGEAIKWDTSTLSFINSFTDGDDYISSNYLETSLDDDLRKMINMLSRD